MALINTKVYFGGYNTYLLTENNTILNCCKQDYYNNGENAYPVKRNEEFLTEIDCNLDKWIGKFGEREDEVIEMGIQLQTQSVRGIILCKNNKKISKKMNCIFDYSDKTKSFLLNNFNENQTDFINYNEINKIIWEFPNLYIITKNNKLYRIVQEEDNRKILHLNDNVISATSIYGQCNYLTQNYVMLKNNKLINLPQLDQNDKLIKFAAIGSLNFHFLLTEKGKVYIYGMNSYGVSGCKYLEIDQQIDNFIKHTELEKKMKSKIVDIKCGYNFCVIRCENGNCYGSGYNYYFDMGIIDKNVVYEFTLLKEIEGKVKQYGCGYFSCAFLTFHGDIYVCGKQSDGQFGKKFTLKSGDLGITLTKLELNGINKFKSVMCSGYHSTFLTENNTILCCNQGLARAKYNFPIKTKEEYFIEIDCNLNSYIGRFGEKKDEIIETGIQINENLMRGIVLCKNFGLTKNLNYFRNNLRKFTENQNLSDIELTF